MTAYDPLTAGVGIYVPDDRHVARARWWLAAHPRTRDRAAIAAGLRRELRGLRHQDVPELMDEVLDGLGTWADPSDWPAEWPEPWGRGEAHAAAIAAGEAAILGAGFDRIDYLAWREAETLAPLEGASPRGRIIFAGHLGRTRLIDNMAG